MAAETRRPYPGIGQALLLLLLQFALVLGMFIVVGVVAAGLQLDLDEDSPVLTLLEVLAYAIVLFVGFRQTHRPFRAIFAFAPFPAALLVPLTPLVLGTGIFTSEVDNLTRWFVPVPKVIADVFGDQLRPDVLSLVSLTVLAPVNEELLFRGLILRGFLARYSVRTAVLASAALFALFHLNPYQYFAAFAAGIILAWLFLRTRSLWVCLLAHAAYNGQLWLFVNVVHLGIPGYDAPGTGGVQFQPPWFDTLGVVLLAGGAFWLSRLFRPRAAAVPPAA